MSFDNRTRSNAARGRSNSMLVIAAAIALVLVLAFVFAAAAIGFGSRNATGRILTVPGDYSTIQAAIDAAEPGDIVRVDPGTYPGNIQLDKPITLTARTFDDINPTNNSSVIDAAAHAPAIDIPAGMTQMPIVRGFVIRNGAKGFQAQSPFIAEYNYILNSSTLADYGAAAGGVNRGNVYFGAGEDAIHLAGPTRPLLIENNRILYAGGDGVVIDLGAAPPPPTVTEIDIWNNMIIGGREDGIQFIDQGTVTNEGNRRFVIARNLIANNRAAGIGMMAVPNSPEDFSGADIKEPMRVYNNTFYGNAYGLSGGGNLVAFNNIVSNSTSHGTWNIQGGPGSDSVIAYSLFFGNGIDAEQTNVGVGNLLGQDPLFVAPPNAGPDGIWETVDDDFSGLLLQANSPAIDRGVSQYTSVSGEPIPADPITGFAGAAPDLGWREYGSPVFMTATPSVTPLPTLPVTGTPLSPTAPATMTSTVAPPTATTSTGSPTPPAPTGTSGSPTPGASATPASTATSGRQVKIEAISPTGAQAGSTVDVTATGTGFQVGATVTLEGGQGPAPTTSNVVVVSPTTVTFTLQSGTEGNQPTTWDIRITNPDGTYALLEGAFTITP